MSVEFKPWPKTPRLFRDVVITEKIDGTNAAVQIIPVENLSRFSNGVPMDSHLITVTVNGHAVIAQSRKRIITPHHDNFGFAEYVRNHADILIRELGQGTHFGEWWGKGIQRGYGMDHRRFSLFNTERYAGLSIPDIGLHTVPVLYEGTFSQIEITDALHDLRAYGSCATPHEYMNPEGICVYHSAANSVFKVLLENDDRPKGQSND